MSDSLTSVRTIATETEPNKPNFQLDTIAGVQSELIDQVPSPHDLLGLSVAIDVSKELYVPKGFPKYVVQAKWPANEEQSMGGGIINYRFCSSFDEFNGINGQYPNFLTCYTGVENNNTKRRNPLESRMAYLTLIANINAGSKELIQLGLSDGITHIVRANASSNRIFRDSGLYKYCDPTGTINNEPYVTEDQKCILYLGKYPNSEIDSLTERFVVSDIVKGLVKTYQLGIEESKF